MNDSIKNSVRPLYEELQGYLSPAPALNDNRDTISSESIWKQYNHAVRLLSGLTDKMYDCGGTDSRLGWYGSFWSDEEGSAGDFGAWRSLESAPQHAGHLYFVDVRLWIPFRLCWKHAQWLSAARHALILSKEGSIVSRLRIVK
jgi:hypothetical protein